MFLVRQCGIVSNSVEVGKCKSVEVRVHMNVVPRSTENTNSGTEN